MGHNTGSRRHHRRRLLLLLPTQIALGRYTPKPAGHTKRRRPWRDTFTTVRYDTRADADRTHRCADARVLWRWRWRRGWRDCGDDARGIQQARWAGEIEERNRPMTDEELDMMFPPRIIRSSNRRVRQQPQCMQTCALIPPHSPLTTSPLTHRSLPSPLPTESYVPRTPARKLMATPTPSVGATPPALYQASSPTMHCHQMCRRRPRPAVCQAGGLPIFRAAP